MSFPDPVSEFVYVRTYARWLPERGRRETWPETVERYVDFVASTVGHALPPGLLKELHGSITAFEVMPSMRALWCAGPAALTNSSCIYNCSFLAVDSLRAFGETLFLLMSGVGVGFSVSRRHVERLPPVPMRDDSRAPLPHAVADSREGFADSLMTLMANALQGRSTEFDYRQVRPAGARLSTLGGRASGAEPLRGLHEFADAVLRKAQGRRLKPIECHDILNVVAEVASRGGVRRSSELSLSDLDDPEMRDAKHPPFPNFRWMANNSASYLERPEEGVFFREWEALASSGTGERGIFNLGGARARAPSRREAALLEGTNPCGEILLRSQQFCNLSEVVVRASDTPESLLRKVRLAAWIGSVQASYVNFPYLDGAWRRNCEEERLLGVSLTGILDNPAAMLPRQLEALRAEVLRTAAEAAHALGQRMPAATTCVKPSGTVSQLVGSASGIHPRFAQRYLRRFRISVHDPLLALLRAQGIPLSPENGQSAANADTWVVSFAVRSPVGALTRESVDALAQLGWYRRFLKHWAEHNVSTTIYVRPDEWEQVGKWVHAHWEDVLGLAFLPDSDAKYEQMPFEELDEDGFARAMASQARIDYSQLPLFERVADQEAEELPRDPACQSGQCEAFSVDARGPKD